jgi:hypothetical protein
MREYLVGIGCDRLLRDAGKQKIAQFVEQGACKPQDRVTCQYQHRQSGNLFRSRQHIDDALQDKRNRNARHFRQYEKSQGARDAPPVYGYDLP